VMSRSSEAGWSDHTGYLVQPRSSKSLQVVVGLPGKDQGRSELITLGFKLVSTLSTRRVAVFRSHSVYYMAT
jgi:hypothetical protein